MPGDATGYLMLGRKQWTLPNGDTRDLGTPWELRVTLAYNFGTVKVGG